MADAPKWTSDPHNFSATRWIYRKETTTITWWPHSAASGDSDSTQPRTDQKHNDWYCGCGTNSWPRRQECFVCFAPRNHSEAKTLDKENPENAPTTVAKGSDNAVDPHPKEKQ